VAFHLIATVASLFNVVPLEGKKVPDRKSVEWDDTAIQYGDFFSDKLLVSDFANPIGNLSVLNVGSLFETRRHSNCSKLSPFMTELGLVGFSD
jgi:hypothetical protein